MRFSYLLTILTLLMLPLTGFADDPDLGPAIYLNNPPSSNHIDSDWDSSTINDITDKNVTKATAVTKTINVTKVNHISTQSEIHTAVPVKTYGPTNKEDHIWALAEKLKPSTTITVQQMMIALQRANTNAFDKGNINALKPGSILRLPTLKQIKAIAPGSAKFLVEQQNKKWQEIQNSEINFKIDNSSAINKPVVTNNPQPTTTPLINKATSTTPLILLDQKKSLPNTPNVNPINVTPVTNKPAAVSPTKISPPLLPLINKEPIANSTKPNVATAPKSATKPLLVAQKPTIPNTVAAKPVTSNVVVPKAATNNIAISKPTTSKLIASPKVTTPKLITTAKPDELVILPPRQAQTPEATGSSNQTATLESLEKEVMADEKSFDSYRQQTSNHIEKLQAENLAMQKQLAIENKSLTTLKTDINTKHSEVRVVRVENPAAENGIAAYLPKTKAGWWILWGAVFLIVLLWLPSPKRKEEVVATTAERQEPILNNQEDLDHKDIKDEYDFMSSQEAIPAKLDLARAYIDMDDLPSAENILKEIVKQGNDTERKRARQMLREVRV